METKQPVWECVGHIGDVDCITYGGGFVYEDTTGVYPPEVAYFEPASDAEWHSKDDLAVCTVYRFILERDSTREWWYESLPQIASFTGIPLAELQSIARGDNVLALANLYSDLISYHGAIEFDSYPVQITEREARAKYAGEQGGLFEC